MTLKHIIAFIREDKLEKIIDRLREIKVDGVSIAYIKGYGEYINTFSRNPLVESVKIEIIVPSDRVNEIVGLIINDAYTGVEGDGIVAVSSIDQYYRIRDKPSLI